MSNMTNPAEPTHIAAHTYIKGEVHLAGPTVVGGRIEGAIHAQDTVEVSPDGIVEGDIEGVLVDVQGTVKGNISATHACRLGPTARVSGEVRAANLAIAEGASFVGQVFVGESAALEEIEAERGQVVEQPRPALRSSIAPPAAPTLAPAAAAVNRIDALTEQVDALAEAAAPAAASAPAVRIVPQTVQHAVQHSGQQTGQHVGQQPVSRGPRIIKAR